MEEFVSQYGFPLISALITAIFGYLGILAKRYIDKILASSEKRKIASICVAYAEQAYKELHGEEKLAVALGAASEMLSSRGIECSQAELRILLESALAQFNKAFEK